MKTVRELLEGKGGTVWTVHPDQYVYEAIHLMAEKDVGALVVAVFDKVVGIVSERDYARKVILRGVSSRHTPVREIMSRKVYYVRPEQTAEECLALMTEKRCRHLPVLDKEKLLGIVTIGDAVKALLAGKEFRTEELENVLMGGWSGGA